MLIASKYEEIYAPQVDEFCYITDNTYTRNDVLAMERTVLDALNFELTQPTIKTFLRRCLRAAESDSKMEFLANFLSELALLDYSFKILAIYHSGRGSVPFTGNARKLPWTRHFCHYTQLYPMT